VDDDDRIVIELSQREMRLRMQIGLAPEVAAVCSRRLFEKFSSCVFVNFVSSWLLSFERQSCIRFINRNVDGVPPRDSLA